MSIEAHPNSNAVGLMFAIVEAIQTHRRGDAINLSNAVLLDIAADIAIQIDCKLDELVKLKERK